MDFPIGSGRGGPEGTKEVDMFKPLHTSVSLPRILRRALGPLAIFLLATGVAAAQSTTATISGIVADERQDVIAGATVTVVNEATRLMRKATCNNDGYFTIPLLPPGNYTLTVERDGFAHARVSNVILNVSDQRALQIGLKAGSVTETVTVDGVSLIDESPAVGTVIDRQFVGNLPMNGRSIQTLIGLSPGVVAVPVAGNGQSQGQFSVNGQRANANYFTVDGVSGNFSIPVFENFGQNASGSIPTSTIQGGFQNLASVDALQEFSIQTSTFAPEFGRGPGAQVSLVTRSGENKYHGSLFEYFRNDVFDARDFFDAQKPPLRFNNFGGTVSGPVLLPRFGDGGGPAIWKGTDKTYFFFSYEGQRFVLPRPAVTTTVPSLALRQNAPNQVARAIFDAHPLPNGPEIRDTLGNLTGGALYSASFSNPQSSDTWSARIDHNFSSTERCINS